MANIVDISKITGINQVGNSYQRKSAVPLDYYSLFNTKAEAEAYAASNPVSYVGQVISYIDNNEVKVCYIADAAGTLKEVGTAPRGDNKTIEVSAEGAVALLGGKDAANGTLPMIGEDGKLTWKTLEQIGAGDGNDNTTYEFSFAEQKITIKPLFNGQPIKVKDEEGNDTEEIVTHVLDLSAFVTADELTEALNALPEDENTTYSLTQEGMVLTLTPSEGEAQTVTIDAYNKEEVDGAIKVAKDRADEAYSLAEGKVDATAYATDKKALQDEDKAIREIAEGVRDAFNTFMNSEEIDATVNTLKEIQAEIAKMTDATELEAALASKADKTYAEGLEDRIETLEGKPFDTYATKSEVEAVDGKFASYTTTSDLETLLAGKQDNLTAGTDYATPSQVETAKGEAIEEAASDASSKAATAKSEAIADAATKYYGKSETYTKTEIDELLDGIQAGSSESAASVNTKLEAYKKVVNAEVWGDEAGAGVDGNSRIDIMETKLGGIAEGAQVNVIESVVVNNGDDEATRPHKLTATVSGKTVTLNDTALQVAIAEAKQTGTSAGQVASEAKSLAEGNAQSIQGHGTKIEGLEALTGQHTADIANLQLADTTHAAEYAALNGTVATHGSDIADLKSGKADTTVTDALSGRITANENAIKTLNETTIPGINGALDLKADADKVYTKTEVEGLISDAKTEATYDDEEVRGLIADNANAIAAIYKVEGETKSGVLVDEIARIEGLVTIEKSRAEGVEADHEERIAEMEKFWEAADDPAGTIDKLAEIVDYIAKDSTGALDMAADIEENSKAIAAIYTPAQGETPASGALVTEIARIEKAYSDADVVVLAEAQKHTNNAIAALLVKDVDNKTIKLNEGKAYVAEVSTDLLVQGTSELHLVAGNASV